MSLPARGFVVFLLSTQVVQGQDDWGVTYSSTEICAVKGSSVEIRCSYTYPFRLYRRVNTVKKTFWFTKQKDGEPVDLTTVSEYAGRVEDRCENNICTLRIKNLTESDSAEYKFRFTTNYDKFFGSPGVTLSVTDLQLKVSRAYSDQAELKCQTSCRAPDNSYIWYKNGEELRTGISNSHLVNFGSADIYSCALNGHENHRSPPVYAPKPPSVSVSPSAEIEEGSSVTVTCSSDANPAANYTWYKNETSYSSILNEEPQFVFSSMQASDSGEYFCSAENTMGRRISEKFFIDVKYTSPMIMNITRLVLVVLVLIPLLLFFLWMRKKKKAVSSTTEANEPIETVELDPFSVYENVSDLNMVSAEQTEEPEEQEDLDQWGFRAAHVQLFECILDPLSVYENVSDLNMVSAEQTEEPEEQEDLGQDDWGVTYTSTKICAVKGSSVEIRCSFTYPPPWYGGVNTVEKTFWFTKQKDGEPVDLTTVSEYAGRVEDRCENKICTLRIRNLRESDSAEYKFRFTTNFDKFFGSPGVTLSVTDLQLKLSRAYSDQAELKCQTSCPAPDNSYIWYKNGEELRTGISYSHLVNFDAPELPSVSVSPSAEIEEGSSVTLTCSSDANPAANYTWYKRKVLIYSSEEHQIVFSSINSSDSGQYFCSAENELGRRTSEKVFIDVKYAPKLSSVSVSPSAEIEEGSSVTLTCSSDANPAANYTWYKENQTVFQGTEGSYNFTSISSEDRGIYYCKSENQYGEINSTSLFIDVQYAPKLPSVSVSPSAEIEEGSSVTLTCSSDANPAANYTWYKNETSYSSILNEEPQFVFSSINSSDSGEYFCSAENELGKRTSEKLFIDVKYKSPMIMNITRLVLVLIPLLLFFLWMRKKKAVSSTTEANEPIETVELDPLSVYENVSDLNMVSAEQTEEPEEQEDLV
ncbi:hypothetical protein NQZ68_013514 [Dissostichus eleginoides]|nr:hypothetical protein NQZ68_013514 [Dissostichus eleginoides]